jgi:ferrochelatase
MRYWHPMSDEAARAVKDWGADEILLFPLYPQFSTTTTGSSIAAWDEAARKIGLDLPTTTLCCFHSDDGFAEATARLVRDSIAKARAELPEGVPLRVLFSAHGLPESIVKSGDPYQWQVEQTVAAVLEKLAMPELDSMVCYQSRVTPQKWIGPSTEDEIERAGHEKVGILICPIAFVSEHSETLVELDVEYREEADKYGVPGYFRVPAQNSDAAFIASLADLVRRARGSGRPLCSFAGARQCPKVHGDCPHARARVEAQQAA